MKRYQQIINELGKLEKNLADINHIVIIEKVRRKPSHPDENKVAIDESTDSYR